MFELLRPVGHPCAVATILLVILTAGVRADELDADLAERDLVAAVQKYAEEFSIGPVVSEKGLRALPEMSRQKGAKELERARQILSDLARLLDIWSQQKLSTAQRVEVIKSLARIPDKIEEAQVLGTGNVVLASTFRITLAGMYFQIADDVSPETRRDLVALVAKAGRCDQQESIVQAIRIEDVDFRPRRGESTYEMLLRLPDLAGDRTGAGARSDLFAIGTRLNVNDLSIRSQLQEFSAGWFAWDVLWSVRFRALCKLNSVVSDAGENAKPREVHSALEAAMKEDLNDLEQAALLAIMSSEKPMSVRTFSKLRRELARYATANKNAILKMIQRRLVAEKAPPKPEKGEIQ